MKRVSFLIMVVVAITPAVWAGPFDAPFTGNVNIEVVGFNFPTASQGGLGNWSGSFVSSTPGTVTIDPSRAVTAGNFDLQYRVVGTTPWGGFNQVADRSFALTGLLDNLGGPYSPVWYPLDPTDAVPPSDPVGSGSGDSNFRTTDGSEVLGTLAGGNVTLNSEKLVLADLLSRTPIPGGEQFVYAANLSMAVHHPGVGNFILNWGTNTGATVTINATPEPASLVMLLIGLGVVARRRR